ncbi:cytochrome bc complex cytochrome b subunit [Modestobacter sp. NPDC049651]|uniref:cytochrome bc1 complex cytochrome b subunit n=1 Tax=unclassified Modestobacter TaxID=2643866 RepID=UPI0033F89414
MATTPTPTRPTTLVGTAALEIDDRIPISGWVRRTLNKVFPDHWSFLLGEIALYSFVVLLLSGTYLTFFYDASMQEVSYNGVYDALRGVEMSAAYQSTLNISFDVRGGLMIRQMHHWAALLFVAAIVLHLLRIYFTGAYRRPRETNWFIGIVLLVLAMLEGFAGYTLPDDLLSGTGLRIFSAVFLSIPVIGTWVYFTVFGGDFPGELIIGRLYILHVLIIPAVILALIALHLTVLVKQKHTQFPGAGRTEHNVVGHRLFPVFAGKATALFFMVFGVCAALGGLVQINPFWLFGPYNPSQVSAGSQPDWYIGFIDGGARMFPPWEIHLWGYHIPPVLWGALGIPGLMFGALALWPIIERKVTGDTASHHLLQRPRDTPVRTSLGVMALVAYGVLLITGGNDIVADKFDISLNAMTWFGRLGFVILPPIAYALTYRICLGLERHDREVLEHGIETGVIRRLPHGEFIEVHQPLGPVDEHGHGTLAYGGASVPKKMNQVGGARRAIKGFFRPIEEPAAVQAAAEREARGLEAEHASRELTGSGRPSEGGRPQEPRD